MKEQYLIGAPKKDFIRMLDGHAFVGCTKNLDEIKTVQKQFNYKENNYKIYKLIEIKQ